MVLAYADDIMMIGNTPAEITVKTANQSSQDIGP